MSAAPLILVLVALLGLLAAEASKSQRVRWVCKPLTSVGYLWFALSRGALDTPYGRWVLAALCLCCLGDVLLLPRGRGKAFLAGLSFFLLGHAAWVGAFTTWGVDWMAIAGAGLAMLFFGWQVGRWLLPRVKASMQVPVKAYIVVIAMMFSFSVGAALHTRTPVLAIGALMFVISDLAVARERFVQVSLLNKLWGLPLYYGAQVVLATTI